MSCNDIGPGRLCLNLSFRFPMEQSCKSKTAKPGVGWDCLKQHCLANEHECEADVISGSFELEPRKDQSHPSPQQRIWKGFCHTRISHWLKIYRLCWVRVCATTYVLCLNCLFSHASPMRCLTLDDMFPRMRPRPSSRHPHLHNTAKNDLALWPNSGSVFNQRACGVCSRVHIC